MSHPLRAVSLDDKYRLNKGQVFLTGTQALVRMVLLQRQRDAAAGLNTAGYVSGYRGSPLGAFDMQLWKAKPLLDENHITFEAGLNEDLAATAIWGTQQLHLAGETEKVRYDGVFGVWYGKGPGVDRSGDAFRHANLGGTSGKGGVLAIAGDDHTCKSSTTAHQSEYAFMDAMIPVVNPASVQDFLDFGLYGIAMSRFTGGWVAMKCVAETVETSASVEVDLNRMQLVTPSDYAPPEDGLNARWPDTFLNMEKRVHVDKLEAARAFARANPIDRVLYGDGKAKLGIVTTGKSYLDLRQAFEMLGLDEAYARELGVKIYHVGLVYPLEPTGLMAFADGCDELLVVEEKRPVLESQIKEILFNLPAEKRPRVTGKTSETGVPLLWTHGEITPSQIAQVLGQRLTQIGAAPALENRLSYLAAREQSASQTKPAMLRIPYFCSGCPHNTSTQVPDGSRAQAGIGCHYFALNMDRNTDTHTHMGAEGMPWVGQHHFTDEKHIFANIGDGTYYHSGLLAIRAAAASSANMTYKILYNDAVAMTGGQPVDLAHGLTPQRVVDQVLAEGVTKCVVVTDDLDKYPTGLRGADLFHRDELMQVQKTLRDVPGVTVLVYEQTCATEKRRRRKRGLMPDPNKRLFINREVCEGCGDCGVQSNCVSLTPVETELGRKRAIDQSTCNKDYSCVKGFCPSFVTVEGAQLRKKKTKQAVKADLFEALPDPVQPNLSAPYSIYITGIGGTGVVTVGALMGMAAHLEGKGCGILDSLGLAQKGGAVVTHVRIGAHPAAIHAPRVATADADLILGCDLVTASQPDAISKMERGKTTAILNRAKTFTGAFTRDPNFTFPDDEMRRMIAEVIGADSTLSVDATALATSLLGDSIAANLFMVGYAYQLGKLPLGEPALMRAVELNGIAIDFNKQAFQWGRRTAHDTAAVQRLAQPAAATQPQQLTLDETIADRTQRLVAYQSARYADRYSTIVARVRTAEASRCAGSSDLTMAVARYLYKLMAYKDEYEVARLYTDGTFAAQLREVFEDGGKISLNAAPPLFSRRDASTGALKKRTYGPWMFKALALVAKLKMLRGTLLDPLGWTKERRMERQLIVDYISLMEKVCASLAPDNHAVAVELACLPESIRDYGHVKGRTYREAKARRQELESAFDQAVSRPAAAA